MTNEIDKIKLSENITENEVFGLVANMLHNYDIDISEAEEDVREIIEQSISIISLRAYRAGFRKGVNISS